MFTKSSLSPSPLYDMPNHKIYCFCVVCMSHESYMIRVCVYTCLICLWEQTGSILFYFAKLFRTLNWKKNGARLTYFFKSKGYKCVKIELGNIKIMKFILGGILHNSHTYLPTVKNSMYYIIAYDFQCLFLIHE